MPTRILHRRTQYPVGQGFFHAADVQIGGATLRYIYDCGSTAGKPLRREVRGYVSEWSDGGDVDSLFLSHIDNDHVAGLDQLLASVKVRNAFLPFLTPVERLALIAHAIDQDRLTSDVLSLLTDPGRWLGDRGVDRVFFISGGEPPAEGGVASIEPGGSPQGPVETLVVELRWLIKHANQPYRNDGDDGASYDERAMKREARKRSSHRETYVIPHTLPIHLISNVGGFLDWVLIPFVHPDKDAAARFQTAVRKYLGSVPSRAEAFRVWVIDRVRSKVNRRKLRGCYHAANIDVNAFSMSLYSGPTGFAKYEATIEVRRAPDRYWPVHGGQKRCGWLGTGDADLKQGVFRQAFVDLHRDGCGPG